MRFDPDSVDLYPSSPGEEELRLEEVRSRIMSSTQIPVEMKSAIAARASAFVDEVRRDGRGAKFYGGQLGWTHYVIRNDHLDFVAILAPTAASIAAFATATIVTSPVPVAVTLLFAIAAIGRKLKSKSATLEMVDYKVLMALKHIGPAAPSDLAGILNGIRIYGADMWDEGRVLTVLQRLKVVSLRDGSVESFVSELPDGRWNTNGV
jgi:hypothetical protein